MGSVGVGKTFLASALGHAACRAGYDVLFIRADQMFLELKQSRADYSHEKALRRFLAPDLLILDDFALRRLDTTQSNDIYEVVIERHRRSSTILTSNRHVDEWIPLFDDPILAQSALDRLSHNAYQVQIEGESYRKGQRPDLLASKLESVHQLLFFTLNREDFSFVIHLDRQPRTSRRREAQTGSRARSGSRSERTLDPVEHSRTLMEWWPFLIFHRGGLRIKVINNTAEVSLSFNVLMHVHTEEQRQRSITDPRKLWY